RHRLDVVARQIAACAGKLAVDLVADVVLERVVGVAEARRVERVEIGLAQIRRGPALELSEIVADRAGLIVRTTPTEEIVRDSGDLGRELAEIAGAVLETLDRIRLRVRQI